MPTKQSVLQIAYANFFRRKLAKYGVTSPAKLSKDNKSKFFTEIREEWQKERIKIKDPKQLIVDNTPYYMQFIQRRFHISKYKADAGMVCELYYSTINKTTGKKKPPYKYLVLLLHHNYLGYTHALRFDLIKPVFFKRLVEEVGLEYSDVINGEKLNTRQLQLNESDSRQFYYSKLKPNINTWYNDSYRTFRIDRTKITNLYKFNFDKLMGKKMIITS